MLAGRSSYIWLALLAAFSSSSGYAQNASKEDELSQFLELLNQQTSLATNTRLNSDFVPGMISVLTAEQLHRRGFRSVWDALAVLPGVITTLNETGMRSISIRGIGESFEPSKVKLLLNGQALNASASATTGTLFDTPVEQVERIELIRGPGSAIYGEFAFAGVLNVITRTRDSFYSVGAESGDQVNFSSLQSFGNDNGDFHASLNLAANQTDGEDIDSGADRTPTGTPGYAPGPVNNKRDFVSAIVNIDAGSLNALIQLQQLNRGDHFGSNNLLPADKKQTVISETMLSATLSQTFDVSQTLSGEWSVALLQNETEQNELFLGVAEVFGGSGSEDDIFADSLLEEQRLEARVSLQHKAGRHSVFGEMVATEITVEKSERFINLDPVTNLPSSSLNEFPAPVDDSDKRASISLIVQDEFRFDDRLTITAGLRIDDYEDIGSNVAPRLAAVWRRSSNHVFKTQLARAFRPPSLVEDAGSLRSTIDPEINDTLEFGHIFQGSEAIIRNTIYFSRLDDLIIFQDSAPFGYRNTGSQNLYGYELEIERSIGSKWDISSSLSLQDYRDNGLSGAAPWMLKLGVDYSLKPLTHLHLQLNSVGRRERAEGDDRSDFEQQTLVDLSLRHQQFLGVKKLGFSWGLRNLLDERLESPSPADSYENDYPYSDDRTLWARLFYRP